MAALAFALAAAGARPYAGGFNDGSRLATVESLLDRGTLAIDGSMFVRPPAGPGPPGPAPYRPDWQSLHEVGTRDMVRVGNHYYSDKPMVPAVLMAAMYRGLMFAGVPSPGADPALFCYLMTVLTSGLSYGVAVGCLWLLGWRAGLPAGWRLVWLAGFALATVLPAYTRHVNASIQLTGLVAALALFLSRAASRSAAVPAAFGKSGRTGRAPVGDLIGVGACAGVGYTLELGSGPLLVAAALGAVAVRFRRFGPVAVVALAALPWVAAHHAMNYHVGGVWVPLGMVPEYLDWPDSPFDATNATGVVRHTPESFARYAWALLFGRDGFLVTNLPLWLAVGAGWLALLRPGPDRIEIAALGVWSVATWLLYASLSNNYGGGCLSVRWLVPCLVPAFWLLARLLAERPTFRADFVALATWGLAVSAVAWPVGVWLRGPVPHFWSLTLPALVTWAAVRAVQMVRRGCGSRPD
jgi:hypothetical protein